jgi:SAM-dependent methyltransferase
MENPIIRKDEVLEKLGLAEYYILQKKEGYRFTIDPILLAGFAETGYHDKILDLGTGGGILPFLLQKNNPGKNLTITGIDIQREYIEMAPKRKPSIIETFKIRTAPSPTIILVIRTPKVARTIEGLITFFTVCLFVNKPPSNTIIIKARTPTP